MASQPHGASGAPGASPSAPNGTSASPKRVNAYGIDDNEAETASFHESRSVPHQKPPAVRQGGGKKSANTSALSANTSSVATPATAFSAEEMTRAFLATTEGTDFMERFRSVVEKQTEAQAMTQAQRASHANEFDRDDAIHQVVRALRDEGVTKELLRRMRAFKQPFDPHKRYLHVQMTGGRAFVDQMVRSDNVNKELYVAVSFRGQRHATTPVPACVDPAFHDAFLLNVTSDATLPLGALLELRDPIHLVFIQRDTVTNEKRLVGTHLLEWRKCLVTGSVTFSVEVAHVGTDSATPVGLVGLRIDLLPKPAGVERGTITETAVDEQVAREREREVESDRIFFMYAKRWWQTYLSQSDLMKHRCVKIFVCTEFGARVPVTNMVAPLRCGELLPTARMAARFVSLIPLRQVESTASIGTSTAEIWQTPFAMMAQHGGSVADHALLLCSFLLGFGLDAYVTLGTDVDGPTVWVTTLGPGKAVTFWEPLTALRFTYEPTLFADAATAASSMASPFRTCSCLFRHDAFYANVQHSTALMPGADPHAAQAAVHMDPAQVALYGAHAVDTLVSFDLTHPASWMALNDTVIGLSSRPYDVALVPYQGGDAASLGLQLERALVEEVTAYRASRGLPCIFDVDVGFALLPALVSVEFERASGLSIGNAEFQGAIKHTIPAGCTFQALPLQFLGVHSVSTMFGAIISDQQAVDIIQLAATDVRMALKVRVTAYAEEAAVVWVMVAAYYRAAPGGKTGAANAAQAAQLHKRARQQQAEQQRQHPQKQSRGHRGHAGRGSERVAQAHMVVQSGARRRKG